jgi:HPt (histidine-containing phosphotransfer) domain-containing protein
MTQAERASAASTAHKLKGSAGNLAIVDVATIATELDHILRKSLCPADCYIRLQQALDIALKSIAQYAGMELTLDNVPVVSLKREQVIPLLERLISAFNTDSPDEIEPVMVELDKHIPALRMKPIRVAVENFDFRGGEAATRSIAIELGV